MTSKSPGSKQAGRSLLSLEEPAGDGERFGAIVIVSEIVSL
jgi:hypothetical protein